LRKNLFPIALKGAIGFLVGLAVWGGLSVPYTRVLASLSEIAIRAGERGALTYITPDGTVMIVDRSDLPRSPTSPRLGIESTDITFNIILLFALFAASSRTFSDRNVFGFAGAAVSLIFVHVAAALSFVKAYYATALGPWSTSRYGAVAQYLWGAAPYFYSVVGVYGFAVALWWLFRPLSDRATQEARTPRVHRATRVRTART
jgi:hypothetical protein